MPSRRNSTPAPEALKGSTAIASAPGATTRGPARVASQAPASAATTASSTAARVNRRRTWPESPSP